MADKKYAKFDELDQDDYEGPPETFKEPDQEIFEETMMLSDQIEAASQKKPGRKSMVTKKGLFKEGTEFRSTYKGIKYSGRVKGGYLIVKGKKFTSLSGAAKSITKYTVNGWEFWKYNPSCLHNVSAP